MKVLKANSRKNRIIDEQRNVIKGLKLYHEDQLSALQVILSVEQKKSAIELTSQRAELEGDVSAWKFRYARLADKEAEFAKSALYLQGEVDSLRERLKAYSEIATAVHRCQNHLNLTEIG